MNEWMNDLFKVIPTYNAKTLPPTDSNKRKIQATDDIFEKYVGE
jgi:hypothetical protein